MVLVRQLKTVHGMSEPADSSEAPRFSEDLDSTSSTPYTSAPSSPGRCHSSGYFFSAPASPVHFVLYSATSSTVRHPAEHPQHDASSSSEFEFDFSSPLPSIGSVGGGYMSSADELFLNGQIRPLKLSLHLKRPQVLSPLIDLEGEEEENNGDGSEETKPGGGEFQRGRDLKLRSRSIHRKARSLSPLRDTAFQWKEKEECTREREVSECIRKLHEEYDEMKQYESVPSLETTPSCSASSSRSSSSGRNSKKWIFLKDLLHRSKSEGRGNEKERFWSLISFSTSKEKKLRSDYGDKAATETHTHKQKQKQKQAADKKSSTAGKPTNAVAKRRAPQSAHELHYTANRAQAEEMKKRTYLPYRHGLFGCLGLSSKGYSTLNGFARSFNPVASSR